MANFSPQRWLLTLLQHLLRRLVRFTTVPDDGHKVALAPDVPVIYALHIRQLSSLLLLDDAARRLRLPGPLAPLRLPAPVTGERSAFFFLTRSGQPSPLVRDPYRYSPRLQRMIEAVQSGAMTDLQVVPVSVFWGRSPQKQSSLIKALLADAWVVPGMLVQALRILIHGRQALVVFSAPIRLRELIDDAARAHDTSLPNSAVRRVGRLLRAEFRRQRELAVGPNLSHRQTLVNALIDSEPVRQAISDEAQGRTSDPARPGKPPHPELRARRIAMEIAADYSYSVTRAFEIALTALWNRLYDGIEVHGFEEIARAGAGAGLIYVPCHRSHVDYLLLSYVIYRHGLQTPYVAAGDNLNLPLIGSLLRRGGAFFLRRSFKGDALYGTVFAEYLHAMISRGFPIEYFIEGGRSRTGYTLPPKAGLLSMSVDSHLREPERPLVFVPVYIGYERLIEGETYVAELSGQPKQRESVLGVIRSLKSLREFFGKVHLNFGQPLLFAAGQPLADEDARHQAVDALARQIVTRINDAVVFNPINLLALALLSAPRPAMDRQRLVEQVDAIRSMLLALPYSDRQVVTPLDGEAIVEHACRHGIVRRVAHPLGDIIETPRRQAIQLAYFRNNVLHAVALPALVATLIVRNESVEQQRLTDIATHLFPFLKAGLFLSGEPAQLPHRLQQHVDYFVAQGLARPLEGGLAAPAPDQRGSLAVHGLANMLRHPLERYVIAISTLERAMPDGLTAAALEQACLQFAQRMVYLQPSVGPEFADPAAFRTIIATLVTLGHARAHEGRLQATELLRAGVGDAPWLLSGETRLALLHLSASGPGLQPPAGKAQ